MYKNLNAAALGVSGRQSEIIELTLTYGFAGMDVDMRDLLTRTRSKGVEQACRFIASANTEIGGFELPISLAGDDAAFQNNLAKLVPVGEIAQAIGAKRCLVTLDPASDELPYHENFERHRTRLASVAESLAKNDIRLGIGFDASITRRKDRRFQFIQKFEELLTLIKSVGGNNVGLLLDTWHWHLGGGGTDQLRELGAAKIVAVRLADVADEADQSEPKPSDRVLPRKDSQIINVTSLLRMLLVDEYDGPVTPWPSPSRFRGMTRESIVQGARDCLETQWIELGLSEPKPVLTVAADLQDEPSETS
ncbi:MAG: TIM barrel protein [Pirellulaceae bacterium]